MASRAAAVESHNAHGPGLNVGTLIGGAVVLERLFALPGMGTQIADAILRRQYVDLQSYVAILALGYVC